MIEFTPLCHERCQCIGTTGERNIMNYIFTATATRLEFKSCLRTLGLGFLFGLGQSFVTLESVGCIPQLPHIFILHIGFIRLKKDVNFHG